MSVSAITILDLAISIAHVDVVVEAREAYASLYTWLSDQTQKDVEKVRDVHVSIGPKGSYFSRCGTNWISHRLPKDLQATLEEEKEKEGGDVRSPVVVTLGIKGSWIVLWSDGTRDWNLRTSYPILAKSNVLGGKAGQVVFAALNPYEEDRYLVVTEQGACNYRAALASKKETMLLHEITDEYMRMRAKQDGTTFSHPFVRDGFSTQIKITPDSYEETGSLRASLMSAWTERRRIPVTPVTPVKKDWAFVGAVATGVGVVSKCVGISTIRAAGAGVSAGVGAALAVVYRG